MKKILIIKTSSLGDIIHTLPALSDAKKTLGEVQFDWVVEDTFCEIPAWHPDVRKVIPVAIRRWRKQILKTFFSGEWRRFKQLLQGERYDYVIDAQGLIKSALITRLAKGPKYGLDKHSAREPMASHFYQYPQAIEKQQHAVERVRQLFAKSLAYQLDGLSVDYGIQVNNSDIAEQSDTRRILFLHGTTWATKHWPETYWLELANQMTEQAYKIILPWGNDIEYQRALRIKEKCNHSAQLIVLDKMNLNELLKQIMNVDAVVAVDTGLAHLSAALNKPTVAIYGPTSPGLTGTYGNNQRHLQTAIDCAPCFKKTCDKRKGNITPECYSKLTPEKVMAALNKLLNNPEAQ